MTASIFWSFAVIVFRSASKSISPFLITALKNTIAFIAFIFTFIILDIPLWHSTFSVNDYIKIIISGSLGMGFADAIFIYALSKIGANRVAIVNSFEPVSIYFFSSFMLGTVLTMQQLIGFIVVIASILVINYEKDADDINPKVKKRGMFLQVFAVLLSSFGIVLIKPILSKAGSFLDVQLWITVFRLLPGVVIAWIIFLFQNDKIKLLSPLKNFRILWKVLLSSGLGTFLALSFWIIGYANISKPPIASILGQSSAIFIVILAWIFLKEKISKIRILSILLASFGVYLSILR